MRKTTYHPLLNNNIFNYIQDCKVRTIFLVSHQMFVRGINAVLIVLSILEICVAIASFLLGITALRSREKREDEVECEKSYLTVYPGTLQ